MMEKVDDKAGFPAQNNVKAFDLANLYALEIITDMVAGQVQRLTPVNEHGVRDTSRFVRFFSSVTVNSGGRPFNVAFEIPGKSLAEVLAAFPAESTKAAMAFLDELEGQRVRAALQGQRQAGPIPRPLVVPN